MSRDDLVKDVNEFIRKGALLKKLPYTTGIAQPPLITSSETKIYSLKEKKLVVTITKR